MLPSATPNADTIVDFLATTRNGTLPADVIDAARMCIVDWFGVALGSIGEKPVQAIRAVVSGWGATGSAQVLLGAPSAATSAALVNGTMAHCLDFDDTHVGSIAHISGPTWAAAYAVGTQIGAAPLDVVKGFVAGFEVAGRLGGAGVGVGANERHFHSTGIFGCFGATAAASYLLQLDADQVKCALGLAATQAAGLTASFGTSGKPFHAGKAAFNGVLAAQLAQQGYDGALDAVEEHGGLVRALIQDSSLPVQPLCFDDAWEIKQNTFKPYASCLLTHPVIDACRQARGEIGSDGIDGIAVHVHPLSIQLAGKPAPTTPFEGKFSIAFCAALALEGHSVTQTDFAPRHLANERLQDLTRRVTLVADPAMDKRAATIDVRKPNGRQIRKHVPMALGNPAVPLSWSDMRGKFLSLTEPVLGDRSADLFDSLRGIETANDFSALNRLVGLHA